jgi:hypothetical protein
MRGSSFSGLLQENIHVGGEPNVVLEEEAVGRVRVDREPRVAPAGSRVRTRGVAPE